MIFGNTQRQTPPREKKEKCEIVVEKTAKGIKKKIIGTCSREQLRALADSDDIQDN